MKKMTNVVRLSDYKPKKEYPNKWAHIIVIIAVTFAVYYNSINNGFVGDDIAFVKDNASIKSLSNIPSFFYLPRTLAAYDTDWGTYIYRPLRTISYALDFAVFGNNAWGFHITNLILHMVVSVTVYFVALGLFEVQAVALISSLAFAVHPVHVEAVSWISSRADLIGLIFLNLSLLSYFRFKGSGSRGYFALSIVSSLVSYLGKETMIPLPGFIIAYDYATRNRRPMKDLVRSNVLNWVLFSAVCFGYLVLRFYMTGRMSSSQGWWGGSAYSNFLMMTKAAATYLWLMVVPFKLTLHYLIKPVATVFDGWVLLSMLAILLSFVLTAYAHRKDKRVFFTLIWFYLALVPISNIVPISFAMMAERYIYMPSMGPIIALSYGVYILYRKAEARGVLETRAVIVGVAAMAIAYSVVSANRNKVYRDDFTFYGEAIRSAPDSAPSYNGLGDQYFGKKDYKNAIANYEKALAIDPNYADAYMGEAYSYMESHDLAAAILKGETAASLKPGNALIRFQLGNIYKEANFLERAALEWQKAIELNPAYSEAYNHLGIYYQLINDYPKALRMFESALKYNPYNTETYYNVGAVYEAQGNLSGAKEYYGRFMKMAGPDYKDTVGELRKRGF
ncbi:MAG: tetratricopeptide repeat protein [Deltaproteobacteria bacterium]|nr:tetratricopeptide repeat protein [Deltaproteobacteria bacterium]